MLQKKLTCLWCISASKTIIPRGKKSISCYKLYSCSRNVNCKPLNDFYRFEKLLFVAEEVRVCAGQLHGRPSHLVTNNVITFCQFFRRLDRSSSSPLSLSSSSWKPSLSSLALVDATCQDSSGQYLNISISKYLNLGDISTKLRQYI